MNSSYDLTPTQINNLIKLGTAPKIEPEDIEAQIVKEEFHRFEGTTVTVCALTLKNGFTVTASSACADAANFKEETGRAIARKNAKEKIWDLEGYVLRSKLNLIEGATPPSMASALTYVGTKVVHAYPMTRLTYNNLRGWKLPDNEDGNDEGYLVEYADGGEPNLPGYKGYVSWSPRDVFERAYTHGVTLKKTTFVERMVKEMAELSEKIERLADFLDTPAYAELAAIEKVSLADQLLAMRSYAFHLGNRLQRQG